MCDELCGGDFINLLRFANKKSDDITLQMSCQ